MSQKNNSLHILIVDDERGMRLGIERTLRDFSVSIPHLERDLSFTIDEAETGEEALEKIQEMSPNILLLDNKLPGMDGIDVLKELSTQEPDILTIMITAYASIEIAVKATKYGAYDFLAKPFTPNELKAVVEKAAQHVAVTIQAKELAEERKKVRFEFISVLAHELKSPINAVEGYLRIIKDRSAGDDPKVYENMMERSLTRIEYMKKLIADLLDMTHIESGQRKREPELLNIKEIAQTCLDSVSAMAKERNISLELEEKKGRPFKADQSEVEIILNNLISNAVKYNKENGTVRVNLDFEDDLLRISVTDTGIGLSEKEKEKLFNDFVRIKKQETKHILGSGLGLSIVQKIAHIYNGSVQVESTPGEGSIFTVELREDKKNIA